jgi:parallel beta-helix repeat protein
VRSASDVRAAAISTRDNRFLKEQTGILAGNISIIVERNEFREPVRAGVHVIGEGVIVRGNRVIGGAAMGVLAENARGAVIENNEMDHLTAYGIMIKGSSNTLVRGNRISNCGYGMAFVLGDVRSPSTAVENTIIEPTYNGIDVIGESPILRRNHVLHPGVVSLSVTDFKAPDGTRIVGKPFLDNNRFDPGAAVSASNPPPTTLKVPQR